MFIAPFSSINQMVVFLFFVSNNNGFEQWTNISVVNKERKYLLFLNEYVFSWRSIGARFRQTQRIFSNSSSIQFNTLQVC